jgi:hypothetical protein
LSRAQAHTCAPDFFDANCDVARKSLAWRPGDFAAHVSGGDAADRAPRMRLFLEYAAAGDAGGAPKLTLAARRHALLETVLRSRACGRDRIADPKRRAVDEICAAFHFDESVRRVTMRGTVLWPTDQLEAAVLDLFDNATAAAAFTATVLATLADAPELREQVARDGVL